MSSDTHLWSKLDEELFDSPKILQRMSHKEYCTPEKMARRYPDSKRANL